MGIRSFSILAVWLVLAAPAAARDTEHLLPAREIAESEKGREYLLDVPFYLKGESHPGVKESLAEMTSERSSSGAFRGDVPTCQSAFLSALKTLQQRAQQQGADAIVDIVSVTRGETTESDSSYRCVAGAFVAHVGLKGRLVKLE